MPQSDEPTLIAVFHHHLHAFAQPLASLQCRLEIGQIIGDQDALREAVEGGLEDVCRLSVILDEMRRQISDQARLDVAR